MQTKAGLVVVVVCRRLSLPRRFRGVVCVFFFQGFCSPVSRASWAKCSWKSFFGNFVATTLLMLGL